MSCIIFSRNPFLRISCSVILILILNSIMNCNGINPLAPFGKVTLTVHDFGAYSDDVSPAIVFDSEIDCPVFSPWGVESGFLDVKSGGYTYDVLGNRITDETMIELASGTVLSKFLIRYDALSHPVSMTETREYIPGHKYFIEINPIKWERINGKWYLAGYEAAIDGLVFSYKSK